jgi:pimeloyl-ACP methyl ester carboxylesterase
MLFLHGAAGSWTTFTPLLRLHDVADPVLFDLPGWGDATPAPDDPQPTIDSISALVLELADRLGYTRWHIVGHSMGGFIALHLAVIDPTRVASVGVVSPTGTSVVEAVRHPWRSLAVLPGFVLFRGAMIAFAAVDRPARAVVRALGRARVLRPFVVPLFRHTARVDQSVVAALANELRPLSFARATRAVRDYDTSAWAAIACPVQSTRGDRDVFVRDRDLVGIATVIADCGHFGTVERPVEVLAALGLSADATILEP